jgi:hypothetical protein
MVRQMKRLLALAVAGMLAFGTETTVFAADLSGSETGVRAFPRTHWRVTKRVVVRRCIEVSQPPRGCPLHRYSRLPWPGVPRLDEFAYYPEYGWHRCWWGDWC